LMFTEFIVFFSVDISKLAPAIGASNLYISIYSSHTKVLNSIYDYASTLSLSHHAYQNVEYNCLIF
jgi:hypothetical protein